MCGIGLADLMVLWDAREQMTRSPGGPMLVIVRLRTESIGEDDLARSNSSPAVLKRTKVECMPG